MSIATQDAPRSPATTSAPERPATTSAAASENPENPRRLFAVTAVVVTPLAFVAALLLALPAGGGNAALIGAVAALFAAGFFGGLYWLAGALERDGRTVVQPRTSEQNLGLPKGSRAA